MIIHIVLNSHLDPVWLWEKQQGIDAVLNTAWTACCLLDDYPEIYITRGESWFYSMVEQHDSALFSRICSFVSSGRWRIVGGWYVQPDCNLASPETYYRHGEFGQRYFEDRFNLRARTGFNPDSFGHGACLPDFYAKAGIENYVFMRPMAMEKELPSNAMIWRSPSGKELYLYRISGSYCATVQHLEANLLDNILEESDSRIGHAMCLLGLGDHGGGPTRDEIEWVLRHRHYKQDVELVFSHPDAYFDALRASDVQLPVVTGELQHHAVGSYTANSEIKRNFRLAENLLIQAEAVAQTHGCLKEHEAKLSSAWEKVLFNSFHDVLAGSAIQSANAETIAELGYAQTLARQITVTLLRQDNADLPDCSFQRMIFDNTGVQDFDGYLEVAPWFGMEYFWAWHEADDLTICTEDGTVIPFQLIKPDFSKRVPRVALHLKLKAQCRKIFLLKWHSHLSEISPACTINDHSITNDEITVDYGIFGLAGLKYGEQEFLADHVQVASYDDISDVWGHGVSAFSTYPISVFHTAANQKWEIQENGQVLGKLRAGLSDGHNSLMYRLQLEKGSNKLIIRLTLNWSECCQVVKLLIRPAFTVCRRIDGVPGDSLAREMDGKEYPFFNYSLLQGTNQSLAIISRDVFGLDVQPDHTLRLTLLRSPYYIACQPGDDGRPTDQGLHEYEIVLLPMMKVEQDAIDQEIFRQTNPISFSEITRGINPILRVPQKTGQLE